MHALKTLPPDRLLTVTMCVNWCCWLGDVDPVPHLNRVLMVGLIHADKTVEHTFEAIKASKYILRKTINLLPAKSRPSLQS